MKSLNKHFSIGAYLFAIISIFSFYSCEDYLNKSPEADISKDDIFRKFYTYQGYVDNIYQNIVDLDNRNEYNQGDAGNYGDELIGGQSDKMVLFDDNCNYWEWINNGNCSHFYTWSLNTDNGPGWAGIVKKGYWNNGWLGIRQANIAIENINNLVEPYGNASLEEQRNLILGQAYFFRAYFHFEIARAWGGIPYIDRELKPNDELTLPRLSYLETAKKINEDLKVAVELLPESWDNIKTGSLTSGGNLGRLTKGAAYAYIGKNMLYAASPLMNGIETGNYSYNTELCKEAVKAFAHVISLADKGIYKLVPMNNYSDNFYKWDGTAPLTTETIFTHPVYSHSAWGLGGWILGNAGGWGHYRSPTHNYIENYGMANGLPIDAQNSGFNPMRPFENRDPRFYNNIVIDGERIIKDLGAVPGQEWKAYAQFYVGGGHRGSGNSMTGYGWKKYHPFGRNDREDNYASGNYYLQTAHVRLADVYLMYAEAANEAYGPNSVPADIPAGLTATQAANIVRSRANTPNIDSRYLSAKEEFREQIRKERAVELSFEGHRWYDLRRWYIAHLPKYKEKYALDFDKDHTYFNKRLLLSKPFEMKHYWLPFPVAQVNIYPGFYQNPGW